jgi:hypothetical protein
VALSLAKLKEEEEKQACLRVRKTNRPTWFSQMDGGSACQPISTRFSVRSGS